MTTVSKPPPAGGQNSPDIFLFIQAPLHVYEEMIDMTNFDTVEEGHSHLQIFMADPGSS